MMQITDYIAPSGPVPAFASARNSIESKCQNRRIARNFLNLVELSNLTFEHEFAAGGTQMSNSLH
jgi:hypothetical protein